jgi:hypothetical protein
VTAATVIDRLLLPVGGGTDDCESVQQVYPPEPVKAQASEPSTPNWESGVLVDINEGVGCEYPQQYGTPPEASPQLRSYPASTSVNVIPPETGTGAAE